MNVLRSDNQQGLRRDFVESRIGRMGGSSDVQYRTNAHGDIVAKLQGGVESPFSAEAFEWTGPGDRNRPGDRRSLEEVRSRAGFTVTVTDRRPYTPGPRPSRSIPWGEWQDGYAPPAVARSRNGEEGTKAYCNRLTDAFGLVMKRLLQRPDRSPFLVDDLVGGRLFTVTYVAPGPGPGGRGSVYVVDDGHAFKIGYTRGAVDRRVASLQTGNPRLIKVVATILDSDEEVEGHLHERLSEWNEHREWFKRAPLLDAVRVSGGWEALLRDRLPQGSWQIQLDPTWNP